MFQRDAAKAFKLKKSTIPQKAKLLFLFQSTLFVLIFIVVDFSFQEEMQQPAS